MSPAAARKLPEEFPVDSTAELGNYEVVGGIEMMSPRPARKHASVATQLLIEVARHFDRRGSRRGGPGGWVILFEPELHLGKDKVVPDLAGWRQDRAPEINDEAAFGTAPDWVCEVVSPGTRKWDREKKMPLYAFHRVGNLWMIDPLLQELEVFALGRRGWELIGTHAFGDVVRAEPFEAMKLDLGFLESPAPAAKPTKVPRRTKARPK
jgi:Uma2 family endonuclease